MLWNVVVLALESGTMEVKDLLFIFIVLSAYYWCVVFPPKWLFIRYVNMAQKNLEKDIAWEKADSNGDGVITDAELGRRERMVLLENRDKKEDQQRWLVWFSALTVTVFIIVLMTPIIPIDRIDHLSGIAEIWILSNMGIIGSFIGFNQLSRRGTKGDNFELNK